MGHHLLQDLGVLLQVVHQLAHVAAVLPPAPQEQELQHARKVAYDTDHLLIHLCYFALGLHLYWGQISNEERLLLTQNQMQWQ